MNTPIDLELQRLACMDRHFDQMIEAARNRDDEAYARAKSAFYNSTGSAGTAKAPANNHGH